jgi:hypothetical protein
MANRCKRFVQSIPLSCQNSRNFKMNASLYEFQNSELDVNPKNRHLFLSESTLERVKRNVE